MRRIRLTLRDDRAREKGNGGNEPRYVERLAAEKIEVHGLAMSEMQRNGRAAIEHELLGHGGQLVPQSTLRRAQDVEARREIQVPGPPSLQST
jgi:hypothetical protein